MNKDKQKEVYQPIKVEVWHMDNTLNLLGKSFSSNGSLNDYENGGEMGEIYYDEDRPVDGYGDGGEFGV